MLRCLPRTAKEAGELLVTAYRGWMADRAPRLGASLAFYTLLSMAPMIIVVVAVAGLAFGERAAQGRLVWEIQDLVGYQGAVAIQDLLKSTRAHSGNAVATAAGLVALFFGASAVLSELRDALNTIWKVRETEAASNWVVVGRMLKERAFSFAMVVGVGFLLLVSLVVNAWLAAMGAYFGNLLPTPEWVLQILNFAVSFVVIGFLFALLFKLLPNVEIEWGDVVAGAALTSLLFTFGKLLIGFYLGKAALLSTYGAAGSLVVVLVWVYYSAQIFFFGAEFTCAYTHRHGSQFRRSLELKAAPERPQVVLPTTFEKKESNVA